MARFASLAALYFGPDLDCRLSLLVSGGGFAAPGARCTAQAELESPASRRVEDGQRQRIDLSTCGSRR